MLNIVYMSRSAGLFCTPEPGSVRVKDADGRSMKPGCVFTHFHFYFCAMRRWRSDPDRLGGVVGRILAVILISWLAQLLHTPLHYRQHRQTQPILSHLHPPPPTPPTPQKIFFVDIRVPATISQCSSLLMSRHLCIGTSFLI